MKIKFLTAGIFIIFALYWISKVFAIPLILPCDFLAIKIDVPLQIQEAITMDKGQNPLLTRFFHNKPLFYSTNIARCYFKYFHPHFLISLLSVLGFFFFLAGLYHLLDNWRSPKAKVLLFLLLSIPLANIFSLPSKTGTVFFVLLLWGISFYGFGSLLKAGCKIKKGRPI